MWGRDGVHGDQAGLQDALPWACQVGAPAAATPPPDSPHGPPACPTCSCRGPAPRPNVGRPRPRRGSRGIRNPGSGGKLVPPRGRTGRFQLQRADRCLPPHPRPVPTASRGSRSRIHLTNSEAFLNQIFSHERLATSTTSLAPAPEPDRAAHGTCRGPGLGGVGQAGPADLQPGLTPLQWHSSKSRVVTTRCPGRRDRISCGRRGARQHPASPPAGPQVRPGLCVPPAGPECQKSSLRQEWPRQARPPSPPPEAAWQATAGAEIGSLFGQ